MEFPRYRHGATLPALAVTFKRAGVIEPITGRVPSAHVNRGPDLSVIVRVMTVVDGPGGLAQMAWISGDLVNLSDRDVQYLIEFDLDGQEWSEDPIAIIVRPPSS